MIGNYLRLPEADLNQILRNPASITSVLYPEGGPDIPAERQLDIEKAWHLIHFLLTGETWEGAEPLCNAVLGGATIGTADVGYGPARYLTPKQVREVSEAIAPISSEELWSRFDADAVEAADIYPQAWEGGEDDRDYICGSFEEVKKFFATAATESHAIILYLN